MKLVEMGSGLRLVNMYLPTKQTDLNSYCPVNQLPPQFLLFRSVWILDRYLEWELSGPPGCDCGSIVCFLGHLCSLEHWVPI